MLKQRRVYVRTDKLLRPGSVQEAYIGLCERYPRMRPSSIAALPPSGAVEAEAPPLGGAGCSPPSTTADVSNPPPSNAVVDSPTPNAVDGPPPSDAVVGSPSPSNVMISSTSWWPEAPWPEVAPNNAARLTAPLFLAVDLGSGYSEVNVRYAADYGNSGWEDFHSWRPTAASPSKQPAIPKSTFSSLAGALG